MKHIMDWMIAEKIAKNDFNAAAIVNGLELYKLNNDDAMKARCKLYRDWRNAGEKSKTAFAKAIAGEPVLAEGAQPMFDGAMLSKPKHYVDWITNSISQYPVVRTADKVIARKFKGGSAEEAEKRASKLADLLNR